MVVLLYIFDVFFALMAFGLVYHFSESKHIGVLLGAIAYGGSAVASFKMMAWWPLAVGFAVSWGIRLLGLDPREEPLDD